MLVAEIGDPRLQALFGATEPAGASVRPIVRLPRKGLSPLLFAIAAVALGVLLFSVLNERRSNQMQPAIRAVAADGTLNSWPAPPPLVIPPTETTVPDARAKPLAIHPPATRAPAPASPQRSTVLPEIGRPSRVRVPPAPPFLPVQAPPRAAPLLIDDRVRAPRPIGAAPGKGGESSAERMRSSALANPSLTVAQGALISAVLETGFDSTRPGFARAIVSRDVRSFDGTNVLIPRGSRLIGESRSPAAQGQKSVMISWTRLIRPDGVTMELDSPVTDSVGRGGIPASVNTHFLSRFGSAVGKAVGAFTQVLAARTGPLLILPSTGSQPKPQVPPDHKRAPTLKVAPGTSIMVFVAHDLDFSSAGDPQ